jgi:hypothetical protein
MNSGNDLPLLPPRSSAQKDNANMENTDFEWLNGNWVSNLDFLTSDSAGLGITAGPASQAAERVVDQAGGEHALPLLRLSGWEVDKQYDKNNPVCIHYDFRWKIS